MCDLQQLKINFSDQLIGSNRLSIRGIFVAIEGLDGAGTTTQTSLLAKWLDDNGYEVYPTKEPTNGIWGGIIRSVLRGESIDVHPISLCHAFMADRVDHIQKITKQTAKYQSPVILSDRYQLSYLAYQQKDTNKSLNWLLMTQEGLPSPNLTIFLDTPASVCIKRMNTSRTTLERFETIDTLVTIRDGYLAAIDYIISQGQIVKMFDGTLSIDELHKEIVSTVSKLI